MENTEQILASFILRDWLLQLQQTQKTASFTHWLKHDKTLGNVCSFYLYTVDMLQFIQYK